jgi:hypothetical protein
MANALITKFCWRNEPIAHMFEIIEDKILKGINFHIAGGSVLKLYQREGLGTSDIDLWFKSIEELHAAIDQWKSGLEQNEQLMLLSHTDNGFTFYCSDPRFDRCFKVQMITKHFSECIERTIQDFDFTVCQVAYKRGRIYMTPDAYRDIRDKVLRLSLWYNRVLCHTRLRKYMMLGYTPTIGLYDRAFVHGRERYGFRSDTINNGEYYDDN